VEVVERPEVPREDARAMEVAPAEVATG